MRRPLFDTVLDVGANEGQYGDEIRSAGFKGRIISFEPNPDAFEKLQNVSRNDAKWECQNIALGDSEATTSLHVAKNNVFSSMLRPTSWVQSLDSGASTEDTRTVQVRRLEDLVGQMQLGTGGVWLKIDTQGYELPVLHGCGRFLDIVRFVQLELSLRPIYDAQPPIEKVIELMRARGFVLVDLIRGFGTESGTLIEIDGIFTRSGSLDGE